MTKLWYQRDPSRLNRIRADLDAHYPTLHLFLGCQGRPEIRGTFSVTCGSGKILDRYQIVIELPPHDPDGLPTVRETGGRIPWTPARHVEADGKACVILPDDRWRCFPRGAPLLRFLNGPVRNFFLGQAIVERGGRWPFGEWGHGSDGIFEYYGELLGTRDERLVRRLLDVLRLSRFKLWGACPCASGRTIEQCCHAQILDLRSKIPPEIGAASFRRIRGIGWSRGVARRATRPDALRDLCGRPAGLHRD